MENVFKLFDSQFKVQSMYGDGYDADNERKNRLGLGGDRDLSLQQTGNAIINADATGFFDDEEQACTKAVEAGIDLDRNTQAQGAASASIDKHGYVRPGRVHPGVRDQAAPGAGVLGLSLSSQDRADREPHPYLRGDGTRGFGRRLGGMSWKALWPLPARTEKYMLPATSRRSAPSTRFQLAINRGAQWCMGLA